MPQVELKEGPLEQFTHEMEPFLRKQGLPVRLNKGLQSPLHYTNAWNLPLKMSLKSLPLLVAGVVELVADHVVCEEGKPLSPEAAQTLVWITMWWLSYVWFRINVIIRYVTLIIWRKHILICPELHSHPINYVCCNLQNISIYNSLFTYRFYAFLFHCIEPPLIYISCSGCLEYRWQHSIYTLCAAGRVMTSKFTKKAWCT